MVAHAAELQTEDRVRPGLVKGHAEAIDIAGHGLRLRDQVAVGRIQTEAVVDVERRHAELDDAAGGHGR